MVEEGMLTEKPNDVVTVNHRITSQMLMKLPTHIIHFAPTTQSGSIYCRYGTMVWYHTIEYIQSREDHTSLVVATCRIQVLIPIRRQN